MRLDGVQGGLAGLEPVPGTRGNLGTRQEQHLQYNQPIRVCEALDLPPSRARARALLSTPADLINQGFDQF